MKNIHNNFKKIQILLILILILMGCSNKQLKIKKPEPVPPLNILYKNAMTNFENGDWQESIKLFKLVEIKYSYSVWASRAKLMIIYIYYEAGQYYEALEYIVNYQKSYPNDKNIVYLEYIKGLCFYEQINITSRDQTYAINSLKIFKNIQSKYPKSIYAKEVNYKIDLINEQLAGKEMYIARFYIKKSKWIAAITRLNIIVEEYSNTIYVLEALHRLVEIYYKLGNMNEAKKYASILGYNFNDSDWYKKSYKIVTDKNYSTKKIEEKIKLKNRIKKIFSFSNDK